MNTEKRGIDLESSDVTYHEIGSYVRDLSESLENSDREEPYTKELESFLENVFEPILYQEIDEMVDDDMGYWEVPTLEENPLEWKDNYDRALEEFEEELEYWSDRLDENTQGMGSVGNPSKMIQQLERLKDSDGTEVDSVYAPVVGGIIPGIVARDSLDAELGYIGFSDKVRDQSRPVSFNTLDETFEGDTVLVDDNVSTGASIIGANEAVNNEGDSYVVTETGSTYEILDYKSKTRWLFENKLGSDDNFNPERLLQHGKRSGIKNSSANSSRRELAEKGTAYALASGFTLGNSYLALRGDITGADQLLFQAEALVGSTLLPMEYKADVVSKGMLSGVFDKIESFSDRL